MWPVVGMMLVAIGLGCGAQPRDGAGPPDTSCAPERCDGRDNNCDGQIDEGFDVGTPCSVGVGACHAEGVTVCRADGEATTCSAQPGAPTAEHCNGIDDNCDGRVDEGFGLGTMCSVGTGACARSGTVVCDLATGEATCSTQPSAATAESCNGLDDNCDGQIDEGFGVGTPCEVGVGACHATGVIVCDGVGATRCDAVAGAPSQEHCNGIDDDCDGVVDDLPGLGGDCTASAPGVCAQGHFACDSNALVCVPGTPRPEICNGLDDNCDGQVDETDPQLGSACATGQPGACSAGNFVCATGGPLLCQPLSAPSSERCNGIDDDCNGRVDDGCLPDLPQARFPWNGLATGSPWLPAGSAAAPLRPRFLWTAVTGAERYELEVDDSCSAAFRDCTFPSPEIRVAVTASSFQPDVPLAVTLTPPVGRRYYWHVRACTASQCSAFTEVRYVDVGRVQGDINGDGYPDLLAQGLDSGPFAVYPGGATGVPVIPAITVSPPPSGVSNAPNRFQTMHVVGDLNGDGFADVCVPYGTSNEGGRLINSHVALYYGGPGGLPDQPSATLSSPAPTSPDFFGQCYGVGDVNGDGQDDLIVSGNVADTVLLYPGSPAGAIAVPGALLADPGPPSGFFRGFSPAARLGDIDGDGYPDFAISAENEPPRVFPRQDLVGAVYVYRGGPAGPVTPPQVVRNTVDPNRFRFGHAVVGNRDLDGDGFADVAISPDPVLDNPFDGPGPPNAVYVYHGSPSGLVELPAEVVRSPRQAGDGFASALALGDVNGDGAMDLVTGDPEFGAVNRIGPIGIAELYLGTGGRFGPSPDLSIPNPFQPRRFESLFGLQVAACDLDADGFDERVISDPEQETPFAPSLIYVYPGSSMPTATLGVTIVVPSNLTWNNFGWVLSCGR